MTTQTNTAPAKLITYIRDGLIEQEHFGYVVRANKDRIIEKSEKIKIIRFSCVLVQNLFKQH